ncbi:MAG: putative toxin-antitoxin system toxin component, PIN family [Patescibacteria group bacterium]
MLKIVLDTNVFLSTFIYHGMSKIILELVSKNKIKLYVSYDLKKEVLEKLKEFGVDKQLASDAKLFLDTRGIFISPNAEVSACRDPKDNYILKLAETCKADYIITRDKDLLELSNKRWKTTRIIKPEGFLIYLRSKKIMAKTS